MKDINERIHALIDGELDPQAAKAVEAELDGSPELRGQADAFALLGSLMRENASEAADSMDFSSLWGGIDAAISEVDPEISALKLQAFVDGELPGRETAQAAAMIAKSERVQQEVEAIGQMGDLLRASFEDAAEGVDFKQMWHRLEAEVGAEMDAKAGVAAAEPATPTYRPSLWGRISAFWGGSRAMVMGAATAVAVV
ncbi:MAG: hypothetical protein KC561_11275, partial [Myxococcales bacterium]|nr:hypothetical protein [Myxococcales bacterium]